jgi:glycosyltransferase involved in cell wall biosynthesis
MSVPTQEPASQAGLDSDRSSSSSSSSVSVFPGPVFLMTNSLERGGTERQFVELAQSLKSGGSSVHLGCIFDKGPFRDELRRGGFAELPQFGLGGSLYGLQSVKTRWRLRNHLRELKIAVAHAFDFYVNLTLVPAAKLARVPVIGSQRQLGDLLTRAQSRAQLEMFRWCDRVVCNSKAAADRLLQAGLRTSKIVVIGNGLPPAAFAATAPAFERRPGVLRIGMVARMNARSKNQSVLLRAAARLSKKFPDAEFLLAGDGPLRADLEKEAADLGIQRQVQFLGDRRDIPAILASLDVSVVPSASESLSNVMIESMAAGVPVVATTLGGNIELGAEGRALLIPADDVAAFATALERMLSEGKLRLEMAQRARRFAEENFSVERIRQQYCELYAELAAR